MGDWQHYWEVFLGSFGGYGRYVLREVTEPRVESYFYGLLLVSLAIYAAELAAPWRKGQPRLRRDFWLDGFYMYFNLFVFSLLGYEAVSSVTVSVLADARAAMGWATPTFTNDWPVWLQLLALFLLRDFVRYWVHRLLHLAPILWRFHKVHHSVVEMGFAAHLRFHWLETVVYRSIEYVALALVGFGVEQIFAVHMLAITLGHFAHANVAPPIGPLRYLINSPQMHIWHHAKTVPPEHASNRGMNFGVTLVVWDWIFGTAHLPSSGRDIALGFDDVERFPRAFLRQLWPQHGPG